MAKSSIHIIPIKANSESHNQRLKKLNYVREDLKNKNSSFVIERVADCLKKIKENYQTKIGQKMQKSATPIREGVLLIKENHTSEDLKTLAEKLELKYGIKTIQAYCHKDEGHWDKITNEWKPNYHAHMIFDWTDHQTGKSIKLNKDDMAEMQTIVAETLELERGISSSKNHLNAIQFKLERELEELEKTYGIKKGLREATEINKKLELSNEISKQNLNYLEQKTNISKNELEELQNKINIIKKSNQIKLK